MNLLKQIMYRRRFKIIFILTIFAFQFAKAQSVSDYEKMLTDDSFQEWILTTTEQHLGDECKAGVKLKFLKENKEVIRKECLENKWNSDPYTWEIKEVGTQWLLIFGSFTYEIDFVSNENIENPDGTNIEMRLRYTIIDDKISSNRVSSDKKKEVIDLFFSKN